MKLPRRNFLHLAAGASCSYASRFGPHRCAAGKTGRSSPPGRTIRNIRPFRPRRKQIPEISRSGTSTTRRTRSRFLLGVGNINLSLSHAG
jgi:hypothetical protein